MPKEAVYLCPAKALREVEHPSMVAVAGRLPLAAMTVVVGAGAGMVEQSHLAAM